MAFLATDALAQRGGRGGGSSSRILEKVERMSEKLARTVSSKAYRLDVLTLKRLEKQLERSLDILGVVGSPGGGGHHGGGNYASVSLKDVVLAMNQSLYYTSDKKSMLRKVAEVSGNHEIKKSVDICQGSINCAIDSIARAPDYSFDIGVELAKDVIKKACPGSASCLLAGVKATEDQILISDSRSCEQLYYSSDKKACLMRVLSY